MFKNYILHVAPDPRFLFKVIIAYWFLQIWPQSRTGRELVVEVWKTLYFSLELSEASRPQCSTEIWWLY
jgi:hypothetical protein